MIKQILQRLPSVRNMYFESDSIQWEQVCKKKRIDSLFNITLFVSIATAETMQ